MGNNSGRSGISTLGLLGIVFIVLKLCGVIHWSWLWVLAPFWGGILICIALIIAIVVIDNNAVSWRVNKIRKMSKK